MTDARLAAAIQHWAPRFVTQGVDYNDFQRTTSALERWEDWLDAWCTTGDRHADLARQAEARQRAVTAGEAWVRAALCYHFAKFTWMVDIPRHDAVTRQSVAALLSAHRHLDPRAERLVIPFEDGDLHANLRRPDGVSRPPLVFLLPGLDSTKEEFFHWEEVFLRRGLATLSLDGPGQGESGFHTVIRADYEVAVDAALRALGDREDVDLTRVGLVGVSLGGYYAVRTAAFLDAISAVVAIGGPYSFGELWDDLPPNTRETFQHHSGAKNPDEARRRAADIDLAGVSERIRQPLLIIFGKQDRLIPYTQAERLAAEAPAAELVMLEEGNHVCNNLPYIYRPLAGDWMAEQLGA